MIRKSFILVLLVLTTQLFAQGEKYTLNADSTRSFHEGFLMVKEGIPFLTVKGNSYEMGLQYGVLLNDYLVRMDKAVDSLIHAYTGNFFLKRWAARLVLSSRIKQTEKKMPLEYLTELKGMAEGSSLSLRDIQVIAYFPQIFLNISCTAFILRNKEGIVHGRNLDWPGLGTLTHFPLIVNYKKENKIPVTVLTFIGYPGVYTGMNHQGLSMSINMNGAPAAPGEKVKDYNTCMPLAFKLRNILENCDELKKVEQEFEKYSSHAWFITTGSKKDHSGAIYELTRGKLIINEMNENFLPVANLSLSDIGRYMYSPVWMFGTSNISREQKLKELNTKISNDNLVDKSYQVLSNTENHHLPHSPFYRCNINNSATIKSCILDNTNNAIYFSYGENMAAFNPYLYYNLNSGEVKIYKEKQKPGVLSFSHEKDQFNQWLKNHYNSKKLKDEDYSEIIRHIQALKLEKSYQFYLLSYYYSKIKKHEQAFQYAEKFIEAYPDYFYSYYHKYEIMRDKGDYMAAIVALETMQQSSTLNPYYNFLANFNMVKMYDKLLEIKYDRFYIEKINKLCRIIKSDIKEYYIDSKTGKQLNILESIEQKHTSKNEQ